MLLDPKNAKPRQKSVLLSPLSQSAGCLTLSFHYTLWGQSPGAALSVLASVLGSIRKHTLFSGQPSPNWQPVSVNYSGPGQIQFTVVGVFGDVPEPAVAVDAISIAPCGESFPQCVFEDAAHPFCDWLQASEDGGRWAWTDKDMLAQERSLMRESPHTGHHYIYLEADKFSRPGQSVRLVSRPFCAPGDVCVEFSYHMYGLGEGTTLQFLLGSPAGSTPVSLWNRVGSQSPDWLNASVTIPSGHQQPMQLVFEAIRGSNTAFVVAMSFILINHGTCHVPVPPVIPIKTLVIPTEQPTVPAEGTTEPPEGTIELPEGTTELPEETTELPEEITEPPKETTIPTEPPTVPTEPPTVPTEPPTVPTEKPTVLTEKPTVPTEETSIPTEPPTVPTEKPTVATEPPTVPTEEPTVATEKPTVPTEETTPPTTARSTLTSLEPTTHTPSTSLTSTTLSTTTTPSPTTVSCPANAHYESCACPASCKHPKASCKPPCQPGCVCDPGLVFSNNSCIKASSCPCLYNNNNYEPEAEWFSPNCTELCHCWPGGRIECQISQCKTHTKCQLKNGQYECQPYGTATCFVYGDPHYVTFDGRHFGFMGKCTYIVAQPCSKSTDTFFRVTAKNEERGQEGMSCLSRVDVTLSETVVTLLKGRRTLVGGQRVTLPAMPAKGVFLGPSGRFVELQTDFGLRVRWDGDQQLLVTVPSAYFQKLCGLCGNYDGHSSNDNLKADGQPAQSEEELGNSWQWAQDEDKECQKNQANPPSCDTALQTKMSGPQFCGQLVDSRGVFETCLLHLKASSFFDNCVFDTCNFQGLQLMLCAHMSAVTAACQDAGYAVKPWREPQFCPLACPPNSRYSLCTSPCPKTCHTGYVGMSCPEQCLEGCECNPGFILSGLECVPSAQCGCLDPSRGYFKVGEQWFKSDCKQLCICEGSNQIHCQPWKCGPHEVCSQQSGIYGCHSQGSATCSASGDPHYLTFDGALHHFMGTCNYVLTQPCRHRPQENSFVVSATNEIRDGNLEVSYVRAVHVQVFNLKISLVKGHKVVLNGRRVALPVWPSRGQVTVRPSGNFMLLYTNFGLRVRYDGNHLVEVTVPSSYAGQLCGLCGNYNNNSLDDNLLRDRKTASNSMQLGAAWKLEEGSETGCFLQGGKPSSCHEDMGDTWNKNCEVLVNPLGPFSQCHKVVPPEVSFTSCVHGQCGTKGDSLTLCRSLQAYASLCSLAGQALAWRTNTFCPLKCPPNSSYSPCGSPCPGTCLSLNHPKDCPITLPCVEGCECQNGYILSGTSCVPLNQCGCTDSEGSYHLVRESWYTDNTCTRLCTCSLHNNITCRQTACKPGQQCWAVDGLLRCRDSGMGVCQVTGDSRYLSFDGSSHPLQGACTYVLAKVCHPNMDLPFFKVSASNEKSSAGGTNAVSLHQVYIEFSGSLVTLQKGNLVLINGTRVALPATSQIRGLNISSSRTHTIVSFWIGAQIKFDGNHVLKITVPAAYYEKVCGICGNYNGEPEDELMMPSDELAASDLEFVKSWKDNNIDPNCQKSQEGKGKPQEEQGPSGSSKKASCSPADLQKVQEQCQAALQTPAWAECASRVDLRPFLLDCVNSLCEFRVSLQPLCKALQALGAACQSKGLQPPIWRNSSFCRTATCFVYGDPHYVTFDGRHFGFMGKCTYIVAQTCSKSTDSFFRVTAKNEERGQEGTSCLSRVDVTLSETVVTLLKGRRTLVGGQRVTLPAMPAKGVFLGPSGRFVELQTDFGLRVRWDGDQQLLVTVPSAYFQKLCGLCGNYDGHSSNDILKADGQPAQSEEELGNSWQWAQDEDKECQKNQANPPSCDTALQTKMSGPQFCGQLVDSRGVFETCLLHLKASSFFDNCVFDTCNFQGLQLMLCAHMSAVTAACQDAGYAVKPWREPQFCPLACPPNSRYSLCTSPCPKTCHTGYVGMSCPEQCLEGCECNPGFILSGLECVPSAQCGCLDPSRGYFKVGEQWFKSDCKQLCICEGSNQIRCQPWKCGPHEVCSQQSGIYGCHSQGSATCSASGDPHYLTFDGALHHFMGTCNYVLTQPCRHRPQENSFVVSATNEIRDGNLEVSYVRAVHVQVFNLKISLVKGHKVVLNGRRVALPVWPSRGQVTIRPSGNFMLLYTNFGLRVRYDGNHLVEVTVPSSYAGQLCGLCGNYNNNSLDDILGPYKRPVGNSVQLGAAWKLEEGSETGCFLQGGKPSSCHEDMGDTWNKNCEVLVNPLGPFSQCHKVVPPEVSFTSCVHGQCGTKGDSLTLCRSLQAYASLCSLAGQALAWRNSTFCPLKCPPNSSYSPCGSPCPGTCLSLNHPKDCPITLPCVEGCECQNGYILSGTSCVPLNQCGCTDSEGSYHLVRESWYTDSTCTRLCTCSLHNNITCRQTACKPGQQCWAVDGLLRCRDSGMGVCQVTGDSRYLSFDGSSHPLQGACTYVLAKVCHPNMDLPFFKVSASNEKSSAGGTNAVSLHQVYIEFSGSLVTLQKGNLVLINGTRVALPATSQIRGLNISSSRTHTIVSFWIGAQIKFDGNHVLKITVPAAYYEKVCGICGNYNGEPEDELMMPSDELAASDLEFVKSWKDNNIDPNCQKSQEGKGKPQEEQGPSGSSKKAGCSPADLQKVQEQCQAALQTPTWAECASRVDLRPFLLDCVNSLCEFRVSLQPLCKALQALGAACQSKGLQPPIWRNSSFCPLACPAYSTYTNCLPSCSPSCFDPDGGCEGARAPSSCAEGCTCQPGYVLSKNKCVAKDQCGCRDAQGGSIPSGKSWVSSGCSQKCACTEGSIQCRAFHCPSRSHCKLNSNGNSNCVSEKSDQCSIFGDPHYRTFDRFSFGFRGRMTYVLIKTVDELPDGVERLLVQARNKMYPPWNKVFLQEIITTVYGYKVQLQRDLVLVVNNQKMAVPYKPEDRLRVSMQGQRLFLITDFEMVVSFDGRNAAVITLPSMYQGLVRGLCGNYDSDRRNEMMLPNGAITTNVDVFGNSWEVKTEDSVLRFRRALQVEADGKEKETGSYRSECSQEQLALVNSTQACRVLVDPQGPFAACHQTVAPEPFQEHCVSDLCASRDPKEHEELRCQVLSGYSITCQEAGIALAGWRDHTHCAMVCPANTVYQSCMTPCPESCANLAAPRDCEGPCVEGCASLPGYAFSGAQSLPLANCGCTSNGIYYQLGHSFVTADCSQRCTCASSGVLLCEPFSCRPGESCTLGNLTRGCFRESPCLRNPCQNDGRCREQGTSFTCECEPGYGGHLCTEPRDVLLPPKPDTSNLVAILLGMLVSLVVTVPVLARKCVSRKRRWWREKTQSLSRDRLLGAGEQQPRHPAAPRQPGAQPASEPGVLKGAQF
ncbi:zonadhesin isoform X2 [Oryctolagus cuniculus]